jgi:ribulose-phosphate 3-epimerase
MNVVIAPSVLAADFARLKDEVERVTEAGADWIHVDVMDGHFVPNITIGIPVVAALRRYTTLPLDVHLMIAQPERYLADFVAAGAASVSVHVEAVADLGRAVTQIKSLGARAGAVVNPGTPVSTIADVAADLDLLVIMSVYPGFTGQAFLPQSFRKVAEARALLDRVGSRADIEIDGGAGLSNVRQLVEAGVTAIVAGAAIFHAPDVRRAVADLRAAAMGTP